MIETFDGLVFLASNLLENVDKAFMRRFQSLVYFDMPTPATQVKIWKNTFKVGFPLSPLIKFEKLAQQYPLTGANINNILRDVSLMTVQAGQNTIYPALLKTCIEQELKKSGRNQPKIGF